MDFGYHNIKAKNAYQSAVWNSSPTKWSTGKIFKQNCSWMKLGVEMCQRTENSTMQPIGLQHMNPTPGSGHTLALNKMCSS